MRLGVALPFNAALIAEGARVAEAVGFDSVWALDAHNRGMMLPDPFTALGVAAAVTQRVELGSCVIQVPLRHPYLLAQQVGSVAAAAGGRFLFGAGSGSTAADFTAVGLDFADRFRLLGRGLVALRTLLEGGDVDGAALTPWPSVPPVPILIGSFGASRWVQKAADDYDGWIGSIRSTDLPTIVDGLKRFRDLAGAKRAVAANLDGTRPDAAEVLAALAEAGFDDATLIVPRHDRDSLEQCRALYPR
jgi:alkanesulfonate monooxygenase SsuD/methylene tetrahydromethanopterin reductase-like flavin-dependent oxidoreductase (luciferase family)